ncbi:MAG: hypothetical protein ACFWUC_10725 [Oscillospiraceae bacterium]|jgi:CRISPR system Cascade subunit CasE
MYLSRIQLDRRDPGVRQCLRNCEDMHRSLMRLFHGSRQEAGVLYRVSNETMKVYLLSEQKPQAENAVSGMFVSGIKDTSTLENNFRIGTCYDFDILVSPSKKVSMAGCKNSRRRLLRTAQERLDWMTRKSRQSGFEIQFMQEEIQPTLYGRHGAEQGGKMYWSVVRFTGCLKIIDSSKFHTSWKQGIGPGRAYGLGMLLLRAKL